MDNVRTNKEIIKEFCELLENLINKLSLSGLRQYNT